MHDSLPKSASVESGSSTTRLGLILFAFYALFYSAFVFLSAFVPGVMEKMPIPGVNLGIVYGFGLILLALILALLYGWMCRGNNDG